MTLIIALREVCLSQFSFGLRYNLPLLNHEAGHLQLYPCYQNPRINEESAFLASI